MGEGNTTTISDGAEPTKSSEEILREQIRMEFYKTYDVMTGVRIAVTLGGFFSLMVLLVVYKSKCKSRSVSEENLEGAAVVEDESIHGFGLRRNYSLYHKGPVMDHPRFASIGGGYDVYSPPTRFGYGRVSLPTSSPYAYPAPYLTRRKPPDSPPPKSQREGGGDCDMEAYQRVNHLLRVPSSRRSSRRLSSITYSSSDTSYLERRGSSLEMGRPIGPPYCHSKEACRLEEEPWDYYYPIDIQVIQPTPEMSPAESELSVYECGRDRHPVTLSVPKIAPLASISSCRLPTFEQDSHSVGSDSVFLDEELIDTEDEVEEFSTDSDADNLECDIPSRLPFNKESSNFKDLCSKPKAGSSNLNRVKERRYSSPLPQMTPLHATTSSEDRKASTSNSSFITTIKSTLMTSSDSDTKCPSKSLVNKRPLKTIPRTCMSASCDQLVKVLQHERSSQRDIRLEAVEHCSWSQETLF